MLEVLAILSLFGGCCLNVLSLEELLVDNTDQLGNVVTFTQFISVILVELPNFVSFNGKGIAFKSPKIPLFIRVASALLFFTGSVLNNNVFMYNISIPLHIVIKCLSTVNTMVFSSILLKKKYSFTQISAALLMTLGAIIASLFRSNEITSWHNLLRDVQSFNSSDKSMIGMLLLSVSTISMSLLSVLNEYTFSKYGRFWQESSFYCHLFSLPLFPFFTSLNLRKDLALLMQSKKSFPVPDTNINLPRNLVILFLNNLTQFICVQSVNLLASLTDAMTLSVVLLIRKFASLLLSVYVFGSDMSKTAVCGTVIVFSGAALYSWSSIVQRSIIRKQKTD